ncbi:ubiquinone anaerobic biosynthesis protein UbiV [Bradyrhizobium sp. HKCCYLRH1062]|uniref:ubiquinone anaerobic biosynthesis protein UbiV n=1 Tax=unclassified Bradyrhizobium TaxID=2631580 RepID=UPI003EB9DBC8
MQLTLGPVLYNWQPERWRDFYFRMADEAPLDRVVVGEVVCSKRAPFFEPHLPEVIERLMAAGKQVLLGSLVLVSLRRERRQTASLAEYGHGLVEVNDLTCLKSIAGRPHAIGPFVNIYNEASAAFHAAQGASRICLPPELPLSSVAAIAGAVPQVAIEVFAFGRVPLAISARCYHARLHKLAKDNCRFVCEQDPDGLVVTTLDNEAFLTMNGVQTLSHGCSNLLGDLDRLTQSGVRSLRLSPQACDMVAVSEQFQAVLAGRVEAGAARDRLREIYPDVPFANGFLHGAPGASYVSG